MCDYSLEFVESRPAKVGDKLISTGFPQTVSRGFASVKYGTAFLLSRRAGQKTATFRKINKGVLHRHHDALATCGDMFDQLIQGPALLYDLRGGINTCRA